MAGRSKRKGARRNRMAQTIGRSRREAGVGDDNWQELVLSDGLAGAVSHSLRRTIEQHGSALGPDWSAAILGFRHSLQGRKPHPTKWYEEVFVRYPGCAYVELCMGDHHHHWSGRFHRARRHYEAAARLDPQLALAHYNRGMVYLLLGLPDRLAAAMRRAADTAGADEHELHARAIFNLSALQTHSGNTREAMELCKQALEIWPEYPEANEAMQRYDTTWLT